MNSPDKKCQWPNQKLIDEVVRTLSANAAMCNTDHHFQVKTKVSPVKIEKVGKSETQHLYSFTFEQSGWTMATGH